MRSYSHICQQMQCLCSSTYWPRKSFCFILLSLVFDCILSRSGSIVLCVSSLTSLIMEEWAKYGKLASLGISFTRQCHHTYIIYTPKPLQISGWGGANYIPGSARGYSNCCPPLPPRMRICSRKGLGSISIDVVQ